MSNASTASLKKDSCLDDDHASTDVYPVHMLDDSSTTRPLTLAWVFRFNDVLDVEKLRDSLTALLEIGDWKKLSGRIQRKVSTVIHFHDSMISIKENHEEKKRKEKTVLIVAAQ